MWRDDAAQAWDIVAWEGSIQWFAKGGDGVSGGRLLSVDGLLKAIETAERLKWNFYLTLNPSRPAGIKARRADITIWRFVLVDLDPIDPRDTTSTVKSMAAAVGRSHNIYSGRGFQWWVELEPTPLGDDTGLARRIERSTSAWLSHLEKTHPLWQWRVDSSTSDLPRLARCPGSINVKSGHRATVVNRGVRQALSEHILSFEPPEPEPIHAIFNEAQESVNLSDVWPHLNARSDEIIRHGVDSPGRHAATYAGAACLKELGVPMAKAIRWLLRGAGRCRPPLAERDAIRAIESAYAAR